MNGFTILLLIASVSCSTARAVFSKRLGLLSGGRREFCKTQAELFFFAAAVIFILNIKGMCPPSAETLVFGAMYGVFTVLAQWLYTAALGRLPVSVCAMVYSFGFIIPTVFGTTVWKETVGPFKIISVLLCVVTVVLSSFSGGREEKNDKAAFLPLIISMAASGGLGIVQKLQQKSVHSAETGSFLFSAFILAGLISAAAAAAVPSQNGNGDKKTKKFYSSVITVGAAMAAANTANTLLAGRLPSVIAFPVTNVGVILASLAVSVIFLKEKISKTQLAAVFTGTAAVLMFNL